MSPSAAPGWSDWQPVAGTPPLNETVLAEMLDGGQSFRWHRRPDGSWVGTWADNVAALQLGRGGVLEWSAPNAIAARAGPAVSRYLAVDLDFATHVDTLPWRGDPHLARCIAAFRDLRILRQPFDETLLGFLCSATKQIVQIKQMLALIAERHGTAIAAPPGRSSVANPASVEKPVPAPQTRRLPTWLELASIPEAELRRCLLGFRARYIAETARFLAGRPGWLDETEALPYPAAKERLCALPGVGEKVADCVLLFGAGRLEAFPVDVWILRTMAKRYALENWRPAALARFGRVHFGAAAGLAQQYLFAWERAQDRTRSRRGNEERERSANGTAGQG